MHATPQPAMGATYAHKVERADAAIDWTAVVRDSTGVERAMYAGLRAARDLVGAEIDEAALEALRRAAVVGPIDARLLLISIRGRALSVSDDAFVPRWLSHTWIRVLTDERAWVPRLAEFLRSVVGTVAGPRSLDSGVDGERPRSVLRRVWGALSRRVRRTQSRDAKAGTSS